MGDKWKKIIVRSIMFISSYCPLYILLIISQWDEFYKGLLDVFYNGCSIENKSVMIIMVVFLIVGIALSIISVLYIRRAPVGSICRISQVKRPDDKVMDYIFTYILPVLGVSLDKISTVIVNACLFALIWFLYIRLNLIFINPTWTVFGYVTYQYNSGYLISDMSLEEISRKEVLRGCALVNGVFLAHRKDND